MNRLAALLVASVSLGASGGYIPPNGFVPDADAAIRIAEAVLTPVYGAATIASEKPLKATLNGDVWIVSGTLPVNQVGGVAVVKISKHDGRILYMMHGK